MAPQKPNSERSKMSEERKDNYRAFLADKKLLFRDYRGKLVAYFDGKLVDSAETKGKLVEKLRINHPDVNEPLIMLVEEASFQKQPTVEITGFEIQSIKE